MAHYLADPPDDLKPFDFDDKDAGDGFDDEIGGCVDEQFIPDEDLYDAINDETFGAEMATLTVDDDFTDFAIRTANLALFDDEPTTSLEAPDPSQIPIPQIGSGQNLQFSNSYKSMAHKKKNIQNAPPAGSQLPSSSSIWATGSFNGIGSLSELYMGHQPKSSAFQPLPQSVDIDQLPNFSSSIGPPPGLFKPQTRSPQAATALSTGTLSAEELERKMLQEVATQINNQNRPAMPAPVNSAELEHKMLAEAMATHQRQKQQQKEEQEQQKNLQQEHYAIMQEMMRGIMGEQSMPMPTTTVEIGQHQQPPPQPTTTMPNSSASMTTPHQLWHQQYLAAMMNDASSAIGGNAQTPSSMSTFPNANGQPMPPLWPNILPSGMPPMPPPQPNQFYQQWQQHLQQAFAAAAAGLKAAQSAGQAGMPPSPFPPSFFPPFPPGMPHQQQPPPGMHPMAFHQQNRPPINPPVGGQTTTSIPPPPNMLPPPPHLLPPTTGYGQSSSAMPAQIAPHLHMVPASLDPHVEKHRRHRANPALPSGKTIADYALDPYAGLMSTKEREWLIKIHIIQCLGTGDPMEDDFYYASWKQKNVLAKAPEGQGGGNENPKYYKFEATFPATNYTAPSFMGALGKPVHSSSRIPRQIIEVGNENLEEESSISGKQTAANRQKRLRAMLMKIENGVLMLIDCRDINRKLRFFEDTCITQYIDKSEITDRLERFAENLANVEASIFAPDQLSTVMLIQKGRHLVFEWLQFLGSGDETRPKALTFLATLMDRIGKFARKIPEESFGTFIDAFRSASTQIPCQTDLVNLMQMGKLETTAIVDSKLIQFTLLTALHALVRLVQNNSASCPMPSAPFSIQQLSGPIHYLLFDIPIAALKIRPDDEELMHFDTNQWEYLRQWLLGERQKWGQIVFGGDNLAKWICQSGWKEGR